MPRSGRGGPGWLPLCPAHGAAGLLCDNNDSSPLIKITALASGRIPGAPGALGRARIHEIIPTTCARFTDEHTEAWRLEATRLGHTKGLADSQPRAPSRARNWARAGGHLTCPPPGRRPHWDPAPRACALTEAGRWPRGPQSPGRRPEGCEAAQAEVGDAEAHDGRLVQLARDGSRQREQLGQLEELQVLLSAPRARRVPGLLLALRLQAGRTARRGRQRGRAGVHGLGKPRPRGLGAGRDVGSGFNTGGGGRTCV